MPANLGRCRCPRPARSAATSVVLASLLLGCASGADGGAGRGADAPASTRSSSEPPPSETPTATPTPEPVELPRGGREIFPRYRLVGYAGGGSEAFGRLGIGALDERVQEIGQVAQPFAGGREIMPVLELITVIAHPTPGDDGQYRDRVDGQVIQTYLDAARRHDAMLLLNVQPGRADFLAEVQALEKWLVHPDVGLALDPEWAVGEDEVPGDVYGSATGAELDGVSAWLDQLVVAHDLPQKVMVFHQVAGRVVADQHLLQPRPGVVAVKSVDGIGSVEDKRKAWDELVRDLPPQIRPGIKLFYDEDARHGPLMTPEQVLALPPQPEYVLFE